VLDESHGPLHDATGTSIVHRQVHATNPGERLLEGEDPAHVREAPAVDRLVVVADEEDMVGRRGQEQGEAQLRAVDILDLVDEQLGTPPAPDGEQLIVVLEHLGRSKDEVVEVEAARCLDGSLVGDEGSGDRPGVGIGGDVVGRHAELDLQARDRGVEPQEGGGVGPGRDLGEDSGAVDHGLDGHPG
jgi:hypothetical protein